MDKKNHQTTLDILVFSAHPDDAELGCGGSIARWVHEGYKVGIVDFTQGELGTRGTPELRLKEATKAKEILGISVRENLGLPDGFFENNPQNQLKIIHIIRKYQPKLLVINAPEDRHPDHARAAKLSMDACFLSGLLKIQTFDENNNPQVPWRPSNFLHYIQDKFLTPNLVIDITNFMETKINSIKAYQSQFYNPNSTEMETYISSKEFWENIYSRSMELGRTIQKKYAEGFILTKPYPLQNISELF
jgi:bacillithiol biosynthesis deacetylase BshB1